VVKGDFEKITIHGKESCAESPPPILSEPFAFLER
jgi:hypothetical protein